MFSRVALRVRSIGTRSYSSSASLRSSSTTNQAYKHDFSDWADRAKGFPAQLIAMYKDGASKISDLKSSSSTDLKVPAIDWAYWEKEIAAPGVVAKLKKEFETQKFDEHSVSEVDIVKQNEEYDGLIKAAEGRVAMNEKQISDIKVKLKEDEYFYNNPEEFSLQDLYRMIPGSEEEMRQQFWNGHYGLDPEERKNMAWDPNGMINHFEAGGSFIDMPDSLFMPHISQKFGDFDYVVMAKEAEKRRAALGLPYVDLVATLPKFRTPKDHHDLLPILQERKDGAPIFGAPVPGHPEGSQSH
jgi:hypothetical protein